MEKKFRNKFLIGLLVLFVLIILIVILTKPFGDKKPSINNKSEEVNVIFSEAELINSSTSYANMYLLLLVLNATNNGASIEHFDSCGVILFNNGKRYDFNIKNGCGSYDLLPGENAKIGYWFTFIGGYAGSLTWEEVPKEDMVLYVDSSKGLLNFSVPYGLIIKK